jgi:hypothetical protein
MKTSYKFPLAPVCGLFVQNDPYSDIIFLQGMSGLGCKEGRERKTLGNNLGAVVPSDQLFHLAQFSSHVNISVLPNYD